MWQRTRFDCDRQQSKATTARLKASGVCVCVVLLLAKAGTYGGGTQSGWWRQVCIVMPLRRHIKGLFSWVTALLCDNNLLIDSGFAGWGPNHPHPPAICVVYVVKCGRRPSRVGSYHRHESTGVDKGYTSGFAVVLLMMLAGDDG